MASRGKSARSKGSGAERKLCALFTEWYGCPFSRTPGSGAFFTVTKLKSMESAAGDIACDDVHFSLAIESKCQEANDWTVDQLLYNESPVLLKWWEQAKSQSPDSKYPCLIATRNRIPSMVFMKMGDFERIYSPQEIKLLNFRYFCINMGEEELIAFSLKNLLTLDPKRFRHEQDNSGSQVQPL